MTFNTSHRNIVISSCTSKKWFADTMQDEFVPPLATIFWLKYNGDRNQDVNSMKVTPHKYSIFMKYNGDRNQDVNNMKATPHKYSIFVKYNGDRNQDINNIKVTSHIDVFTKIKWLHK